MVEDIAADDSASGTTSDTPSTRPSRTASAKRQYLRLQERVNASAPGRVRSRARELDIANHALILASLSLTLLIPALVTLSAVLPIGSGSGIAAGAMRRLGLGGKVAADIRQLLPTHRRVVGSTTVLSGAFTMFFAIGWPSELARGYLAIWQLPRRGLRDLWRTLPWLGSFFAVLATVASSGLLVAGLGGAVVTGLISVPLTFVWMWWSQHLLLGGRIGWRPLLPGALATSLLLFGFSLAMHVYLPHAIIDNFNKYGPIGIVLAFLSWIIGFSTIMLGGPLVGHTFCSARQLRTDPAREDS